MSRLVRDYEERDARDQLKLQRLVDYAETADCRWRYLLDYFGRDAEAPGRAAIATAATPGGRRRGRSRPDSGRFFLDLSKLLGHHPDVERNANPKRQRGEGRRRRTHVRPMCRHGMVPEADPLLSLHFGLVSIPSAVA